MTFGETDYKVIKLYLHNCPELPVKTIIFDLFIELNLRWVTCDEDDDQHVYEIRFYLLKD